MSEIDPERWERMTQAEKAAAHPGRHRIRFLADKGRYVCSKRFCDFATDNLTYAMSHVHEKSVAA